MKRKVKDIKRYLRFVTNNLFEQGFDGGFLVKTFPYDDVDMFTIGLICFEVEDSKEYKKLTDMGYKCKIERLGTAIRIWIDKVV